MFSLGTLFKDTDKFSCNKDMVNDHGKKASGNDQGLFLWAELGTPESRNLKAWHEMAKILKRQWISRNDPVACIRFEYATSVIRWLQTGDSLMLHVVNNMAYPPELLESRLKQ